MLVLSMIFLILGTSHALPTARSSDEQDILYDDDILDDDDNLSVYKELESEDYSILTELEKLYTAYMHETKHDTPLLSILDQGEHTMTILVRPRHHHQNTKVRYTVSSIKTIDSLFPGQVAV